MENKNKRIKYNKENKNIMNVPNNVFRIIQIHLLLNYIVISVTYVMKMVR